MNRNPSNSLPPGCELSLARKLSTRSSVDWIFYPSLSKICLHVIVPCAQSLQDRLYNSLLAEGQTITVGEAVKYAVALSTIEDGFSSKS